MAIAFINSIASVNLGINGGATGNLDTTGSKLLIMAASYFIAGSMSDNQGNSWTPLHEERQGTVSLVWWYCINPNTSVTHTFTYSGVNTYPSVVVSSYSGTPIFDQKSLGQGLSTSMACGPLLPANGNSLVVSVEGHEIAQAQSVTEGLTIREDNLYVIGQQDGLALGDIVQGVTPAAINPSWSSAANNNRLAAQAVFYEVGGITARVPLIIDEGLVQQLQSPDVLTGVAYSASEFTTDNALVRVHGTAGNSVQESTATIADTGALTMVQDSSLETSGAHLPIFTIEDSAAGIPFQITAFLATSANVGIGENAGANITTATDTTLLGANAGASITEGNRNVCIGGQAGNKITTGVQNFALGAFSCDALVGGDSNIGIGYTSLFALIGEFNVAVGSGAGRSLVDADRNVFLGYLAGFHGSQLVTAQQSVGIGSEAYTTGNNGIAIGYLTVAAANQVVIGNSSITETVFRAQVIVVSNGTIESSGAHTAAFSVEDSGGSPAFEVMAFTAASENMGLGVGAGGVITSGTKNLLIGPNAGAALATGTSNIYVGVDAGKLANGASSNNVGIGRESLDAITSGGASTAVGTFSCSAASTASGNAAFGYASLLLATGGTNTCFGTNSGRTLGAGADNIFVGSDAGHTGQLATATNCIGIGVAVVTTASNQIIIGSSTHTDARIYGLQFVAGGSANAMTTTPTGSSITGGNTNTIDDSTYAHIGGGINNDITSTSTYSAVGGGLNNNITASLASTIGGGTLNDIITGANYSTVGGGNDNNIIASVASTIGGGLTNSVNATDYGTIAGGLQNDITSTSTYSTVGGGIANDIDSSTHATIGGGAANGITVASAYAVVSGGFDNNIAGGIASTICGGYTNNIVAATAGTICGGQANVVGDHYGMADGYYATTNSVGERAHGRGRHDTTAGSAQESNFVVFNTTTNAAITALFTDGSAGTLNIPANACWTFLAHITGLKTDGSVGVGHEIKGVIKRNGAAAAGLVGAITNTVLGDDSGATYTATANANGNTLRFQVTGVAATNINWTASVRVTQVLVES